VLAIITSMTLLFTKWARRTYGSGWAALHHRDYMYGVSGQSAKQCFSRHGVLLECA